MSALVFISHFKFDIISFKVILQEIYLLFLVFAIWISRNEIENELYKNSAISLKLIFGKGTIA